MNNPLEYSIWAERFRYPDKKEYIFLPKNGQPTLVELSTSGSLRLVKPLELIVHESVTVTDGKSDDRGNGVNGRRGKLKVPLSFYRGDIDPTKVQYSRNGVGRHLTYDPRIIGKAIGKTLEPYVQAGYEILKRLPYEHIKNPYFLITGILEWIKGNIRYNADSDFNGLTDTNSTIRKGEGNSEGIANVYITLANHLGVDTFPLDGILLKDGKGSPHSWAKSYLFPYGWVEVDPALGQFRRIGNVADFDYGVHGYRFELRSPNRGTNGYFGTPAASNGAVQLRNPITSGKQLAELSRQ